MLRKAALVSSKKSPKKSTEERSKCRYLSGAVTQHTDSGGFKEALTLYQCPTPPHCKLNYNKAKHDHSDLAVPVLLSLKSISLPPKLFF